MRLIEIKQRFEEKQIREENRKKCVEVKTAEAELEVDSGYVELFASSVGSHRETADKRTKIWVDNVLNLNPVVTVTEPTANTSELIAVPYNGPLDVDSACSAQLGGLCSTMLHGVEAPPMIPNSLTQIAAGTKTRQNVGEYGSNLNQDVTQPRQISDSNQ